MVTYGLRRTKTRVRILAPHPLFLILALYFLCGSAGSVDLEHYAAAPDTLASAVVSDQTLASAAVSDSAVTYAKENGYDPLFNVGFYLRNGLVTQIGNYRFTGRADGVQELATELYDVTLGVNDAFQSLSLSSSEIESILTSIYNSIHSNGNTVYSRLVEASNRLGYIYSTLHKAGDSGTVYSRLVQLVDHMEYFPNKFSEPFVVYGPSSSGDSTQYTVSSFSDAIKQLSRGLSAIGFLTDTGSLNADGTVRSGQSPQLYRIVNRGFQGLASLMLGDSKHDINGLGPVGYDKVGHRGSWSLADITGNGFSGLAYLLAGESDDRGLYTYLGLDGTVVEDSPGSVISILGEGFLGLSRSLWPDRKDPSQSVVLDFISPDDGTSPQQYEHDNLAQLIAGGFSGLQNPLARLAFVLADPDDIELKQQEKPNMDAVKDEFFGDGQGAVNPGDIKDVAGISSSAKDAFASPVAPSDAFVALSSDDALWFFTQEVADDLDTVNQPALASDVEDDVMDRFVIDEDGFASPADLSPWDVFSFLGGSK